MDLAAELTGFLELQMVLPDRRGIDDEISISKANGLLADVVVLP